MILTLSVATSWWVSKTLSRAAYEETVMLPTPGFHHLHLNAVDPDAAIDFYTRQFSTSRRTTWSGLPAVKARPTC